jgi:dipeptidyl aminopeptidase/acylaminoacyl peptidase
VPAAGEKENPPVRILDSGFFDWNGSYSPDGRQVTFASFRSGYAETWVANSDGSNPRQVTFLEGLVAGTARWSPDGRELCFSSNKPGNVDIYIAAAAGGIPRQLTTDPSSEFFCSWSRDGRWVYFDSGRSGRRELWKVSAGGGAAVQVTRNGGVFAQETPDGRSLFFTKAGLLEPGAPGLWRMPAEGGLETQVLPNVVSDGFSVVERGIYVLNRTADPGPAIEFYDFASRRVRRITRLAIEGELHSWGFVVSPDERSFLYTVWRPPKADIVLVENFR